MNGGPQLLFAGGNTVEVLGLTVKDLANGEDLTKCWGHRHGAVVPIGSNEGHAARRE